jgi:hypothetical protein
LPKVSLLRGEGKIFLSEQQLQAHKRLKTASVIPHLTETLSGMLRRGSNGVMIRIEKAANAKHTIITAFGSSGGRSHCLDQKIFEAANAHDRTIMRTGDKICVT